MKVLMTSDTYLPEIGGAEYHIFYLKKYLEKNGIQVKLFVTCTKKPEVPSDVYYAEYKNIWSLLSIARLLWKESKHCDVIHGHYSYRLSSLASIIATIRRKPFVITQHGLGLLPQVGATKIQDYIFKLWRFSSQYVAKKIISTSEDMSVEIRSLGFGTKIVPITNGYDPEIFSPLPPVTVENTIELLTVRRLVPKNGIQYAIAALQKLPGTFRLTCVGEGRYKEELITLAKKLGVYDRITFVGKQSHETTIQFFKKAHIVLFPSSAESTSLACIEAMALEKIIIASRIGGLIELIGNNNERGALIQLFDDEHSNYDAPLTLPEDRITNFATMILQTMQNLDHSYKKAKIASEYARENYTWNALAKKTITVYKEISK